MKQISSTANNTVKFIRSLHSRKGRKQSGKFYIEGVRQVGEAVENGFPVDLIAYSPELLVADYGIEMIKNISNTGIEVIEVTAEVFTSFSVKDGPHGIAAVGTQRFYALDDLLLKGLWIALEDIQDPGNLGAILRSLDGAGGKGLILIGNTTDPYHPTAVRSSMGALFYIPIVTVDRKGFVKYKNKKEIFCVGTVCDTAHNYKDQAYYENMVVVMGSEQKGISNELRSACDSLVTIPMAGKVDSLNLANAASIVLFEIYSKQRQK